MYERNYYREGDDSRGERGLTDEQLQALLLDDTVLPNDLSIEEEREACRALRGSILRQEIYADDGTDAADRPYSVSERNYSVRKLQGIGNNTHGVFFTHARETIDFHYERKLVSDGDRVLADPRVSHQITLTVDDFGNVEREVAVGYARRDLPGAEKPEQRETYVTLTANRFANEAERDGWYRVGVPVETRTYELVKPPEPALIDSIVIPYSFIDVVGLLEGTDADNGLFPTDSIAPDVDKTWPYEKWDWRIHSAKAPTDTRLRLIEHQRTYYRKDDLSDRLALGKVESLALPYESYQLAFTPELIANIYGDRVSLDLLQSGGYVHTEGDDNWWIPSGRVYCASDRQHTPPARELEHARAGFYLPLRFDDPFRNPTTVEYDDIKLLVRKTEDALHNTVRAEEDQLNSPAELALDYRVLQPRTVTDSNGNRSKVAFDILGMVTATSVMGKITETKGDMLPVHLDLNPAKADLERFDSGPRTEAADFLDTVSSRVLYDLWRTYRTRNTAAPVPVYAATIVRETHVSELSENQKSKLQVSFSYSDGFGREIQKKIQAEPEKTNGVVGPPRWVGSGWTIFNNKGKPVRQYEPFFSELLPEKGHCFEFGAEAGVSPILFYDPLSRVVATIHPNHTWEKVVFDPWRQTTWDVNDTVLLNPAIDDDVRRFLLNACGEPRIEAEAYSPTWYELRTDPSHVGKFEERYSCATARSNQTAAAKKTEAHANTPSTAHLDTLGRPFLTESLNRVICLGHVQHGSEEMIRTCVELDIEGNQRTVKDERRVKDEESGAEIEEQRVVMRYDYSIVGPDESEDDEDQEETGSNLIHQSSMEAGERWTLNDVSGNPIRAWNSRGHVFRTEYDPLRRPIKEFVFGADPEEPTKEVLTERLVYGEQHPDAKRHNLRGQLYLHLDQAGAAYVENHDFKGYQEKSMRRLTSGTQYRKVVNWRDVDSNHTALPINATQHFDKTALKSALARQLEDRAYSTETSFDALNRPVKYTTPDRSVTWNHYNQANFLEAVDVNLHGATDDNGDPDWTPFVLNIDYNEKGQHKRIEYGCGAGENQSGVTTTYDYDKETYRLKHLWTKRPEGLNGLASKIFKRPTMVQDLYYTYDPIGNIIKIDDSSLENIAGADPVCKYTYDAQYRLIKAVGREHTGQTAMVANWNNETNFRDYPFQGHSAHSNNLNGLKEYTECYTYDAAGNFDTIEHKVGRDKWRRRYFYEEQSLLEEGKVSNRLTRTVVGRDRNNEEKYTYVNARNIDSQGCMTAINNRNMVWDFDDQLQIMDLGGGGTAYCVYDARGQRVRKIIENQNGQRQKERIYLGDFEIYSKYENNGEDKNLERETLHIMDDEDRIALVETRTDNSTSLLRYQFNNHLGSASIELTGLGALISYEEYHPYGTTAFQIKDSGSEVSLKRYRYSGKERDEETGLYYHGARYLAPWLGRWISCDPVGLADGVNSYKYVSGNPSGRKDPTGYLEWSQTPTPIDQLTKSGVNHIAKKSAEKAIMKTATRITVGFSFTPLASLYLKSIFAAGYLTGKLFFMRVTSIAFHGNPLGKSGLKQMLRSQAQLQDLSKIVDAAATEMQKQFKADPEKFKNEASSKSKRWIPFCPPNAKEQRHYGPVIGRQATWGFDVASMLPKKGENPKVTPPGFIFGIDNRCHLVAKERGGSGKIENIVACSSWTNTKEMRRMEILTRALASNGVNVCTLVVPLYNSKSKRPAYFFYGSINSNNVHEANVFPNTLKTTTKKN